LTGVVGPWLRQKLEIVVLIKTVVQFWSSIRTSLPRFEVSRDVDSGTRDLGRDLPDVKTSGNFASELSP